VAGDDAHAARAAALVKEEANAHRAGTLSLAPAKVDRMPEPVPFVTLDRQHAALRDELSEAFERVVDTSGFILGAEVEGFESEFAAYCDALHCVGVGSGTAALILALIGAGIGPGDEVIVPAHTFIASALAVVHAGATPVFCDVDDATGLIDPDAVAAAVTERTAAIVPVHLYGQCCDMDRLGKTARDRGLFLLEDAAQAHGATWDGRRAGSLGDAAAFSFYPSKNLGALGDGGAVTTRDPALAERVRALRDLGQLGKGNHQLAGFNERLDGMQAALLRVKLPHLDAGNGARREHAATYRAVLGDVRLLAETGRSPCVYHLFPVRVPDRDGLRAALADEGIGTGVHYSPAVPDQPPFAAARSADDGANARAWAAEELSLPMSPELTRDEVERSAEALLTATIASRPR
jgi:dTDP-4-amino-4,6-dideoxygalactose transaminase